MKEHWIWLTTRKGLGPVGQRQLLRYFGSAEEIWAASDRELARAGISPHLCAALRERGLARCYEILEACTSSGTRVLTPKDGPFPQMLEELPGAPLVLYVRGQLPDVDTVPAIAVVGARAADSRGLRMAEQLGWQIAGCGGIVVTGLARGIDAAAARGALRKGGRVIGVLGCGPDIVYPAENADLFADVMGQGCLLSEYPPGTKPNPGYFPARNRVISALSVGVVVVQASRKSGALITAQCAVEQNRDVYAVPGAPNDPLSAGCNHLLRSGAILAECGWDVMQDYEYRYPGVLQEYHGRPKPAPAKKPSDPVADTVGREAERAASGGPDRTDPEFAPEQGARELPPLTPIQERIVSALGGGPAQLDALIDNLDLPAAVVLPQLTVLQMRHVVDCGPGRIYSLV